MPCHIPLLRNPPGAPCQTQHPWSMAQCAMRLYRVLGIKLGQPRGLLWFRVRDGVFPWPVRSGKATHSVSGSKGRNLCSDRAFHHQHLRKLYKLILASLVEKSIKILPGFHVWGIVQSAYTNTLCLAMTTLTPFSFSLENVHSIPFTGWTTAVSAEAYNACRGRSSSPFGELCRS